MAFQKQIFQQLQLLEIILQQEQHMKIIDLNCNAEV